MSVSAAAKSAAYAIGKNVKSTKLGEAAVTAPFLSFKYECYAKPLNCARFPSTRDFASDDRHPLHLCTQRRLAAFDRTKLHWNVIVPTDLSKKAVVRNWAVRRVRAAFREVLREDGCDGEGSAVGDEAERRGLSGALCIFIAKNKAILDASGKDVKVQCRSLLKKIVEQQRRGNKRADREYAKSWKRSVEEVDAG